MQKSLDTVVRIATFTFSASGFGFGLKHKIFFRFATILQQSVETYMYNILKVNGLSVSSKSSAIADMAAQRCTS